MVAYSFQARFIVPITDETKWQTIRRHRKGQAKPGSTLQLYYAQRTVYRRLLGIAECALVEPVTLQFGGDTGIFFHHQMDWVSNQIALDAFAFCDGFADWDDLRAFWDEHHPGMAAFQGDLIRWTNFRVPSNDPVPQIPGMAA